MKRKYYYLLRIKSVGCCNAAVRFAVSFPALHYCKKQCLNKTALCDALGM